MLKIKTANVKKAIEEIKKLERIGCEIVRVAVKDSNDAGAIRQIKKKIKIPLVADIHFNWRLALESIKGGVDKIRINPGNISKLDELKQIIKSAKKRKIPIRIGVNSGSIPRKIRNMKLADFARKYIKVFEHQNFRDIIISLKSSSVTETIDAYRILADSCDYPFHLGVTAAGPYDTGIVKSSIGIGSLLVDGIGDTIRVSLTGDSREEVIVAKEILQSLRLRNFGPDIISCPTCGRCQVDLVNVVNKLQNQLSAISYQLSAKRPFSIAVMGCEVNGPGEASDADIGVAAGKKYGALFKKGRIIKRIKEKDFVKEIIKAVRAEKLSTES
jgi:(E)-4-hydroxy-3-methylbut-2-enyl-diphosphate synthase